MFWIVFLFLLLLALVYLLLVPIVLYIDTTTNKYYIRLKWLAKASIQVDEEELLRIRLNVLFLYFNFYPLRKSKRDKKKKSGALSKKRKTAMNYRKGLKLLISFKVKRFLLNIDTGNCISNAKLYPIFVFLNYRIGGFHVNFQGNNQLVLHIQNRPIHIIKSFIY